MGGLEEHHDRKGKPMTGIEHYREAERLLGALNVVGNPTPAQVHQVQIAQLHATLALAAAALPVCSCPAGMRYHAQNCLTDPGQLMNPGAAQ